MVVLIRRMNDSNPSEQQEKIDEKRGMEAQALTFQSDSSGIFSLEAPMDSKRRQAKSGLLLTTLFIMINLLGFSSDWAGASLELFG